MSLEWLSSMPLLVITSKQFIAETLRGKFGTLKTLFHIQQVIKFTTAYHLPQMYMFKILVKGNWENE